MNVFIQNSTLKRARNKENSLNSFNIIHTQLHPDTYTLNEQYFYSSKVYTYVFELPESVLLFDLPTYSKDLEQWLLSFKKPINAVLSHGSCGIPDGSIWQEKTGVKVYLHKADAQHPWLMMQVDELFSDLPRFDNKLQIIHTPGHSGGSVCLLDKQNRALFTGDTIYGNEEGVIRDISKEQSEDYENPIDRMNSCKQLLSYNFDNIYPFHYKMIIGHAKTALEDYLKDK